MVEQCEGNPRLRVTAEADGGIVDPQSGPRRIAEIREEVVARQGDAGKRRRGREAGYTEIVGKRGLECRHLGGDGSPGGAGGDGDEGRRRCGIGQEAKEIVAERGPGGKRGLCEREGGPTVGPAADPRLESVERGVEFREEAGLGAAPGLRPASAVVTSRAIVLCARARTNGIRPKIVM